MSRKLRIEQQITEEFSPQFLSVEDESQNHHVPVGAQTHFKIIVVASQFNDLTRILRHKMMNNLLKKEFETGLHALSMHLYTIEEWQKKIDPVLQSPNCKDGFNN